MGDFFRELTNVLTELNGTDYAVDIFSLKKEHKQTNKQINKENIKCQRKQDHQKPTKPKPAFLPTTPRQHVPKNYYFPFHEQVDAHRKFDMHSCSCNPYLVKSLAFLSK